jgi:hypothetical protein
MDDVNEAGSGFEANPFFTPAFLPENSFLPLRQDSLRYDVRRDDVEEGNI